VKHYTADDDQLIRDAWPCLDGLARSMGRRRSSLSARGRKLGLPRQVVHRRFSESDRQLIVERYPEEGPQQLARELGRSVGTIVGLAGRLGAQVFTRWSAEDDARFAELRKRGKGHKEISIEINRSEFACAKRSQALGLSRPHFDPVAVRKRNLQQHVLGHMGPETRWARERIALGEHGWPPDLNPKEIAILNSLLTRGAQERKILALSIGEPPTRNPKKFLMTHGGISAMARIMTRGLVTRLRLDVGRGEKKRGRRMIYIYALTATALAARGTYQSVNDFNHLIAAKRPGESKREKRKEMMK